MRLGQLYIPVICYFFSCYKRTFHLFKFRENLFCEAALGSPKYTNLPQTTFHQRKSGATLLSLLSSHGLDGDDEYQNEAMEFPSKLSPPSFPGLLTESPRMDDDRRPVRPAILPTNSELSFRSLDRPENNDWGIDRPQDHNSFFYNDNSATKTRPPYPSLPGHSPRFSHTRDQVAHDAAQAIAYTLIKKDSRQDEDNVDPNWLTNLWAGDRFWKDRRPVRQAADRGRIGIEIDVSHDSFSVSTLSLTLAGKLATLEAWKMLDSGKATTRSVPVVVYFNTIQQALLASQELNRIKILEEQQCLPSSFDTVSILPLGEQDTDLPLILTRRANNENDTRESFKRSRKHKAWLNGNVDPRNGIIVVVQPTDYNLEHRPPGPSIGTVPNLQRLVARASLLGVPVILISPRFWQGCNGWDQSGYQQSASFGGMEPPTGPTPWLLRDFGPPIYSWVGQVVKLSHRQQPPPGEDGFYYYSQVSMVQSILHRRRVWHIFAKRQLRPQSFSERYVNQKPFYYEYLASTKSSAGRPTRDICRSIWEEFASFSTKLEG